MAIDWGSLILLAGALTAGGLFTGFLAGLLGIGGGGILVPILWELFRFVGVDEAVRMHLAVGTALAVIVPTSLRSFHAHYRQGAVDMDVLHRMGPLVALGVVAGILIARVADGSVLKSVYVASCVVMASKLYAGGARWRLGEHLPGAIGTGLVATVIGLVSTLIGIGGGVFISGFMTLYGRPIHRAVATAAGFGPIIAVPAALGYIWAGWDVPGLPPASLGYVSLLGAGLIIPLSVLTAPIGVRVAHGIDRRKLELAFAAFLTLVAIRFLASLLLP